MEGALGCLDDEGVLVPHVLPHDRYLGGLVDSDKPLVPLTGNVRIFRLEVDQGHLSLVFHQNKPVAEYPLQEDRTKMSMNRAANLYCYLNGSRMPKYFFVTSKIGSFERTVGVGNSWLEPFVMVALKRSICQDC